MGNIDFQVIFVIENSIQIQNLVSGNQFALGAITQVIVIFIKKLQFACQIVLFY